MKRNVHLALVDNLGLLRSRHRWVAIIIALSACSILPAHATLVRVDGYGTVYHDLFTTDNEEIVFDTLVGLRTHTVFVFDSSDAGAPTCTASGNFCDWNNPVPNFLSSTFEVGDLVFDRVVNDGKAGIETISIRMNTLSDDETALFIRERHDSQSSGFEEVYLHEFFVAAQPGFLDHPAIDESFIWSGVSTAQAAFQTEFYLGESFAGCGDFDLACLVAAWRILYHVDSVTWTQVAEPPTELLTLIGLLSLLSLKWRNRSPFALPRARFS